MKISQEISEWSEYDEETKQACGTSAEPVHRKSVLVWRAVCEAKTSNMDPLVRYKDALLDYRL